MVEAGERVLRQGIVQDYLLDMNRLFERFVHRWVSGLLAGGPLRVQYQQASRTILWNADTNRSAARVIPDLLIGHRDRPGVLWPVDAKYKTYDERQVASGDIYQTFLYAFTFHRATSGEGRGGLPAALLLYPATRPDSHPWRLHVRSHAGRPQAELALLGVHIPTALDEALARQPGDLSKEVKATIEGYLQLIPHGGLDRQGAPGAQPARVHHATDRPFRI